ncbi:hypothetical protein H2248_007170 [Termitomyces sp. 'cryptogamus']|nr:hypothetical protein H2248_007170 [Termitomyces sp. 'cryptogamus']
MDPPNLSFIGIVDFSQEAKWIYMTPSVYDLLGYEPGELIGRPSLELVHPDEFTTVKRIHHDTIVKDKAAVLLYLRMKHKIHSRGYILCGIVSFLHLALTTTDCNVVNPTPSQVVHNVLVGSVSFANPTKAMHNASTAQEIEIVSPTSPNFQAKRWHDPPVSPPRPPSLRLPTLSSVNSWNTRLSPGSASESDSDESSPTPELQRQDSFQFSHLPNQSLRTLFILDRFTEKGTIMYCSNDCLVTTLSAIGRPFFDYVHESDEGTVKKWIETVKGWGVNELGQPSDGGFGYGCFTLLAKGRDSSQRVADPVEPRHRIGRHRASRHARDSGRASRIPDRTHAGSSLTLPPMEGQSPEILVDAIFSAHSDGLMVVLRRSENA